MKKLIFSILLTFLSFSFTLGATLSITPSKWTLWTDCIEEFSIMALINPNEYTIWADLFIDSNMEFVGFENGSLFKYSPPVKVWEDWILKIAVFGWYWQEVNQWWLVGKLLFKVSSNIQEPYIDFVFNKIWSTTDTNLAFNGGDILTAVYWWKYTISNDKTCVHNIKEVVDNLNTQTMDEFIEDFEDDYKFEKQKYFLSKNFYWIIWGLLIIIIFIILFIIKRKKNKWK